MLIATPRISRGEGAAADAVARWMVRHGLDARRHRDSTRSHSADEYIRPDEVRAAIDTYLHVLQGLHF